MTDETFKCPDCEERFDSLRVLGLHFKTSHPQEPVVLNISDFSGRIPPNSIYCGRGSFAGNPYRVGVDGSRDQVIERYIAEKKDDATFMARVRKELRGVNLVCHCAPRRCHCDWLLIVANTGT